MLNRIIGLAKLFRIKLVGCSSSRIIRICCMLEIMVIPICQLFPVWKCTKGRKKSCKEQGAGLDNPYGSLPT